MSIALQADDDPVAVGLSMKYGTCIVAIELSHLSSENATTQRLQRGHTIIAVDGQFVDPSTVGKCLRDGPVGSLVLIRARDDADHEFQVELQRQFSPFGKLRGRCSRVRTT
jgi:hypothetical protein